MHIVVNASVLLTSATGVGTFIHRAARALGEAAGAHRFTYYYGWFSDRLIDPEAAAQGGKGARPRHGAKGTVPFSSLRRAKALLDRYPVARSLARRVAHGVHRLSAPTRRRRFDLYWEPNYVPVALNARRLVVTVHDLSLHVHPEWHPKDRVAYFARHFAEGLARADAVTADSEFTRGELMDACRLDPARVRVVYPGCDPSRFHPRSRDETAASGSRGPGKRAKGLPERFVLVVGALDPRKNVARLLDAWAALPASRRRDTKLVLTGFAGFRNRALAQKLRAMERDVISLGYLSAEDLADAYASASALAYPSLYEGFGLPALEAMASGCPVVASDIPPLREVCGSAAEWVDPASVESIAAGIERVLADDARRKELVEKGLVQSKRFTWESTARGLLSIFDSLPPDVSFNPKSCPP